MALWSSLGLQAGGTRSPASAPSLRPCPHKFPCCCQQLEARSRNLPAPGAPSTATAEANRAGQRVAVRGEGAGWQKT